MNEQTKFGNKERKRREFLEYILGGGVLAWLVSILYPIIAFLQPPKEGGVEVTSVKAGKLEEIEKDSGRIIKFGNKPVLLIRTADDQLRAFTATCTHLDCTVQFKRDAGIIWCACHNGKYDLNGKNIAGPPPRPLEEYRVTLQGNEIFISKKVK
ncbi:MAG: Rieske (2Fe-2S) protein [bacterium]